MYTLPRRDYVAIWYLDTYEGRRCWLRRNRYIVVTYKTNRGSYYLCFGWCCSLASTRIDQTLPKWDRGQNRCLPRSASAVEKKPEISHSVGAQHLIVDLQQTIYNFKWLRIRLPKTGNRLIILVKIHVKIPSKISMIPQWATILASAQATIASNSSPEIHPTIRDKTFFSIPRATKNNLLILVSLLIRRVKLWDREKVWMCSSLNVIVLFDWTRLKKTSQLTE